VTRPREPIFNVPAVVLAVAAILAAIHIARSFLSVQTDDALVIDYALIPARELSWFAPELLKGIVDRGPLSQDAAAIAQYQLALYLASQGGAHFWSFVTYALLHEGGLHLGLNVVVLAALGTPVARRFGAPLFLALLLAGAIAGGLIHVAVHPEEVAPLIGASAGVSACVGAAARFVFDPIARLGGSAPSLATSLRNRSVVTFTLGWFFANAISGLGANPSMLASASIAWEAHIGGFLLGFLVFALFDPVKRRDPVA